MTLEIIGLQKKYNNITAVNNFNLKLPSGRALGLLGRNGAGKTTTIKMLLGLLKPNGGEILWDGKVIDRKSISIGYLPEERGLYPKAKINKQLIYFGQLEGMSKGAAQEAVDYWLGRMDITHYKHKKPNELSKGNQQKIQLISTLLHNPELIILDEPFDGLDPINANLLSNIIEDEIIKGKTVILSSHRIEQIEPFCQDICLLNNGDIVLSGDLINIKQTYGYRNLSIHRTLEIEQLLTSTNIKYVKKAKELIVKVKTNEDALTILNNINNKKIPLRYFKLLEPTLNEIFIERTN